MLLRRSKTRRTFIEVFFFSANTRLIKDTFRQYPSPISPHGLNTLTVNGSFGLIACSQTLYFLFKVRRACVIKNRNRGGLIDRQRKGVGVGEEENRRSVDIFGGNRNLLS